MLPTYHYIVPPNACLKKKTRPMQGTVAVLRTLRITVSYCPEIANHCFLSYILKNNKKWFSTSKTPETAGC